MLIRLIELTEGVEGEPLDLFSIKWIKMDGNPHSFKGEFQLVYYRCDYEAFPIKAPLLPEMGHLAFHFQESTSHKIPSNSVEKSLFLKINLNSLDFMNEPMFICVFNFPTAKRY